MQTRTTYFETREVKFTKGSRYYIVRVNSKKGTTAFCSYTDQADAIEAMHILETEIQKEGFVTDLEGYTYGLED